jgi:hypothetical protein
MYAVRRADGKIMDIRVTAAGGYADSASQDKFCAGSTCVFWTIYDQSSKGNHLGVAKSGGRAAVPARPAVPAWAHQEKTNCAGQDMPWPGCRKHFLHGCVLNNSATIVECEAQCKATAGCVGTVFAAANCSGAARPSLPTCWLKSSCRPHPSKSGACRTVSLAKSSPAVPGRPAVPGKFDRPTDATADPLTVGGHNVYGVRMDPPSGYRRDNTTGIATNDEPTTMYAVFNGSHYNNRCCFDYVSTTSTSRVTSALLCRLFHPVNAARATLRQTITTMAGARWKCVLNRWHFPFCSHFELVNVLYSYVLVSPC